MDVLVEQGEKTVLLSDLGFITKDVGVGSAAYEANQIQVPGRNGQIDLGGSLVDKSIVLALRFVAKDQMDDLRLRDVLYALFTQTTPFYVSEFRTVGELAYFERPGEHGRDGRKLVADSKRYLVVPGDELDISFIGASTQGLLSDVMVSLVTAELPYGESRPLTENVTDLAAIHYEGSVACSQLESPFSMRVMPKVKGNQLKLTVGDKTLLYKGAVNVGDVFLFNGVSNERNGLNVNHLTNYAYFVLQPNARHEVSYTCNLAADITIINKKYLYV